MMEWLWNSSEKSNAFMLARSGYDVWLGNNRGNRYSNTHTTLDNTSKEYWDYYQQDMGEKDLPAFIDFILESTGKEKISYVGHSEGTTQMFLGASLKPDYFNERINLFVALAPVANTAGISSPMILAMKPWFKQIVFFVVKLGGVYNWIDPSYGHAMMEFCRNMGME